MCWGSGVLSFTVIAACLSVTVLYSDSTHFPSPQLQWVAVTDGQCGGSVFASQVVGGGKKKLKTLGLENYTTLAINPCVS